MITYHFLQRGAFEEFFPRFRHLVFGDDLVFDPRGSFSPEQRDHIKQHAENLRQADFYTLVAKDGDQIVGWSHGIQKGKDDFVMQNSGVLKEYRRKGVYREMLKRAVGKIVEMGYQRIYSRHKMSNNAIIIPKLRFGFIITGFDVTDLFGATVVLSYFINPLRRDLMEVRIGSREIGEDLEPYIARNP